MASSHPVYLRYKHMLGRLLETPDFSIPTWLAFGASLQLLSQTWLPSNLSWWLPLLYLIFLITRIIVKYRGFTVGFSDVRLGRWTTRLPESEDPSAATETSDGIVMFLLGARINHPLGKLAPGVVDIGIAFENMWKEAEDNRAKWSYLGRSEPLFDISDNEGITTLWVSYWKDLKGLQKFASSPAHSLGQMGFAKGKFPHMGIMHETYHAPKGHWETIYDNCPPLGLGRANYVVNEGSDGYKLGDVLGPAAPRTTMFSRMGRGRKGEK